MATADLKVELECSICLSLYKEPISLKCGHNFCWDCIVTVLDTQEKSGEYSCPDCRENFAERPTLVMNRKLRDIVECFQSSHRDEMETFCTYCDSPVPATKSCLHCEASFCEKHLTNHSKGLHHILTEPIASFKDRKCPTHHETFQFYCTEDNACICMPCLVAGDHKGHQVDLLNQASEKMKEKLKETTNVLDSERQEIKRRIQNLEMYSMQETGKNVAMARKVTDLFREIRKQLDEVEKRILLETCRQKKQLSQSIPNLIQQLEQYNFQLSKKIDELEELCNTQDPLTVLKKASQREDSSTDIGDPISDVRNAGGLSEGIISRMLQKGLSNFTDNLKGLLAKRQFSVLEKSDVLLDINTAHDNLVLTRKRKRVTHTDNSVNRPDGPKRFKCCQILSIHSFTSGINYWEVDVSEAEAWMIGVAGESMERGFSGNESFIGFNDKSWSLIQKNGLYVRHKNVGTTIASASLLKTVGICLDYESGLLSFYQLCNPIRHLHTFTTTFTEPLHAAFYVFPNSSLRLIK
ncbi:TPA: hypothetical protein GDO54_018590 [Pyxicephalus adspersus]|uniref:Uncharacterized protein n=1 Tax=Pyxicephalus adspersus TaxID=30357 RepID=A0AAV2ZP66_PYXAD|nr:TPA: hypothetical protein GDO54_018590 [Pyxicephalus adspersus]